MLWTREMPKVVLPPQLMIALSGVFDGGTLGGPMGRVGGIWRFSF